MTKQIHTGTGDVVGGDQTKIERQYNLGPNSTLTLNEGMSSDGVKEIVNTLEAKHSREIGRYENDAQSKDQQINALTKALTEAVMALSQGQGIIGSKEQINQALAALTQGDTEFAKALFAKTAERGEDGAKDTAAAYRHLGALAFLDNTQEALKAYRRATELDPDNVYGWNQLGQLLNRTGDLSAAITAYQKVLSLGEENRDQEKQAWAYGNLGIVYGIRGELDKAVEYFHLALALDEGLDSKEGMVNQYGNLGEVYRIRGNLDKAVEYQQKSPTLNEGFGNKKGMASAYGNMGNVYQTRGDLDKAMEYLQKSLALNEELGSKEGMAINYGNLGNSYKKQGNKEQAKQAYQKSLELFKAIGNPTMIKKTQALLDVL